jgi:hypothetical protein
VFLRLELRTLLGELVDCALVLPDIIGVSGPGDAEGIARVLPPLQARQGLPRRRRGWDVSVMAPGLPLPQNPDDLLFREPATTLPACLRTRATLRRRHPAPRPKAAARSLRTPRQPVSSLDAPAPKFRILKFHRAETSPWISPISRRTHFEPASARTQPVSESLGRTSPRRI